MMFTFLTTRKQKTMLLAIENKKHHEGENQEHFQRCFPIDACLDSVLTFFESFAREGRNFGPTTYIGFREYDVQQKRSTERQPGQER